MSLVFIRDFRSSPIQKRVTMQMAYTGMSCSFDMILLGVKLATIEFASLGVRDSVIENRGILREWSDFSTIRLRETSTRPRSASRWQLWIEKWCPDHYQSA
jgi:hypothetical protein